MTNENERKLQALEMVLEYHNKGYIVHPLDGWTKKPLCKGWKDIRYTKDDHIKSVWQLNDSKFPNVGLHAVGMIVVDLDLIDGKPNPFYTEHENDWFASCPISQTGSGGHQAFFRHPENKPILTNSVKKIAPGVDIRTNGGNVCLPPSRYSDPKHPECYGNIYKWIRPLPSYKELPVIPDGLYDKAKAAELKNNQHSKPVKLISLSSLNSPNKTLSKKLSKWVREHKKLDKGASSTCLTVYGWLIKAFAETVKHDHVSETFLANAFIRKWLKKHPNQAACWDETVNNAYRDWASPKYAVSLEEPRYPVEQLPDTLKMSEEFSGYVNAFETLNDLKLDPAVYAEIEHIIQQPSKKIYELICGGGKGIGSIAWVLFDKSTRYLIVKERKEDLYTLKEFLEKNGEQSVGLLVGYDKDSCRMEETPNRFLVYDRQQSPCLSCENPCAFYSNINPEERAKRFDQRVLLITHKMFMSLMAKHQISEDWSIIIDEGLKSIEDFTISPDIENSLRMVFPAGSPGHKLAFGHINHMRNKTNNGSCYLDDYNCMVEGEDYIKKLKKYVYKRHRKTLQEQPNNHKLLKSIEDCLSWLYFLGGESYRAVISTQKGLKLRSAMRDMNLPNTILVLDGSASISRTMWKDFTIYKSSIAPPQYPQTTLWALPYNPTKNQLKSNLGILKHLFLDFMKKQPKTEAWIAVNKDTKDIQPLLDEIIKYYPVTIILSRGRIVGSNNARLSSQALISMSVFSEIADYALSACLYNQQTIDGKEIFRNDGNPRMNQWGFESKIINHEFQRQYCDELYQSLMRGVIRENPQVQYDAFCFLSSDIIASNLLRLMPGTKIVDATDTGAFSLLELFLEQQPDTLQEFINLAKLDTSDNSKIETAKVIFALHK